MNRAKIGPSSASAPCRVAGRDPQPGEPGRRSQLGHQRPELGRPLERVAVPRLGVRGAGRLVGRQGQEEIALEQADLGQDRGARVRADDREGVVERAQTLGRPPGARACARLHEQQVGPEDRRRPELAVHGDPRPDLVHAHVDPAEVDPRRAEEHVAGRRPDVELVLVREVDEGRRELEGSVRTPGATAAGARVVARVRGRERVVEGRRELERGIRPCGGLVGPAQHPQGECGRGEGGDPRIGADPRRLVRGRPFGKQRDRLFEVVEAAARGRRSS